MSTQHEVELRLHTALTTATLDGTLTVRADDLAAICREAADNRREIERLEAHQLEQLRNHANEENR